jgi:hypothetical protein
MPVLENGSSLGLDEVSASDSSEVEKIVLYASVLVENSVYSGHNGGASCGTPDALEFVGDFGKCPLCFYPSYTHLFGSRNGCYVLHGDYKHRTNALGQPQIGQFSN